MEIVTVTHHKKQFLDLLLLADEQEDMVDRYLKDGDMFALYDPDLKGIAVVLPMERGVCELKNLAIEVHYQRKGYGSRLVTALTRHYGGKGYRTMLVGTGESPATIGFYEHLGFSYSHRVKGFFTDNYDHPIIEQGVRLTDMLYFSKDLSVSPPLSTGEIEQRALELLREHGLADWAFRWDHAKRRLGSCHYAKRQITLSRHFAALNAHNEDQIADTILHEIAHAMAWVHHGERGHGKHWKQYCRQLGADPRAAAAASKGITSAPYRYFIRIRDTGEIVGQYYRKPSFARHIKSMMIKGRPETKGRLELIEAGKLN